MEPLETERCSAPTLSSKPDEYQPVPMANINAPYPTIQAAPPYSVGQNAARTHFSGPRPNNYIVLTLITLCCCMGWPALFCSIIAIIYSMQVDLAWDVGQQDGARKASKNAKNWAIGAIVTGVAILIAIGTVYGVIYAIGAEAIANGASNSNTGYSPNSYRPSNSYYS